MKTQFKIQFYLLMILTAIIPSIGNTQSAPDTVAIPNTDPFPRVELGIRYMPTFSSFDLRAADGGKLDAQLTLGYGVAGVVGFNFSNNFGIEANVIYNAYSQTYSDQMLERTLHVQYLDIPLLLSLNTGKNNPVNLNLVAGPQFGFNLGSRLETTGATDSLQAEVAIRPGDIGFAYGVGLGFMLNASHTLRLDLGFRGVYGFTDINESNMNTQEQASNLFESATIKTYSGYVGFAFAF